MIMGLYRARTARGAAGVKAAVSRSRYTRGVRPRGCSPAPMCSHPFAIERPVKPRSKPRSSCRSGDMDGGATVSGMCDDDRQQALDRVQYRTVVGQRFGRVVTPIEAQV